MRAALEALEAASSTARRDGTPFSVQLIDGDNLRQFNQIGYEAGDDAIRDLGCALLSQLRETDFLARWRTGDEFLILLPDTLRASAAQIGQRLCSAVESVSKTWLFPTTISIGVAVYPDDGQSVGELVQVAEKGLKTAKERGKNQVVTCG